MLLRLMKNFSPQHFASIDDEAILLTRSIRSIPSYRLFFFFIRNFRSLA
jgi:hypothetical protein